MLFRSTKNSKPVAQLPPRPPKEARKREEFIPYTFDPKSVIEELKSAPSSHKIVEVKMPINYKPVPTISHVADYSHSNIKSLGSYQLKRAGSLNRLTNDISMITNLDSNYKQTEDYNAFSKEFEKEFGNDQKEIEHISNELITRRRKLENFVKELQTADLNMILFRNKLIRELEDVGNDLNEGYNHIMEIGRAHV